MSPEDKKNLEGIVKSWFMRYTNRKRRDFEREQDMFKDIGVLLRLILSKEELDAHLARLKEQREKRRVAAERAAETRSRIRKEQYSAWFANRNRNPAPHSDMAKRIVDAGYKALAQQLHPDKGGVTEDMQELNIAREKLKRGW